ncbi:double zinc ribbon domain-containing protein [Marisediminicola senii]|uniref:double zinc ribbon domain-containing protein n=1 Tax=Marisediminicola senii TaxID=2711233 RepID=UPI0013ECE791|nr:zinc ribbon domain-containing protein [Marisediminicola senii]
MNCEHCGEAMPADAIYCGMCGRAVIDPDAAALERHRASSSRIICTHCGAVIDAADSFCPDCGHVAPTVSRFFSPRDTGAVTMPGVDAAPGRDSGNAPGSAASSGTTSASASASDLGETRLAADTETGDRFVLQFSTGESVAVTGFGLVGRNPRPEPGEGIHQLVRVLDPTRSVSKTHLEFGQDDGAFWITDRFSGNGTTVSEPDAKPYRCEPGRRHRIARGTRVDMGEQFFVIG